MNLKTTTIYDFIFEKIDKKYIPKLETYIHVDNYGVVHPVELDYWCANYQKQEFLLFRSWVSAAIARVSDNSSFYYYLFLIKDYPIYVELIYHNGFFYGEWNEHAELHFRTPENLKDFGLTEERLTRDIKNSISLYKMSRYEANVF